MDAREQDDSQLIAAFQAGDAAAFTVLVERHRRALWGVAWGILRNAEQADEALQDALVKAWRGLPRFQGDSTFRTWVHRITMNAAFDLRSRERAQGRAREQALREGAIPVEPTRPRALDDLIRDRELRDLHEALESLPERQRLTLTLRLQEDLKYENIARLLDCTVGTVKANVHHAVKNLRRRLAGGEADTSTPGALDAATGE